VGFDDAAPDPKSKFAISMWNLWAQGCATSSHASSGNRPLPVSVSSMVSRPQGLSNSQNHMAITQKKYTQVVGVCTIIWMCPVGGDKKYSDNTSAAGKRMQPGISSGLRKWARLSVHREGIEAVNFLNIRSSHN
jgi:hypothetical protein